MRRLGATDRGEYRQASRFATLNPPHRSGDEEDTRNAKATDAIQVEQTYTARWGAGPAYHQRFRTDADAKYVSAGR
jgi:hypothetical protein